MSLNTFSDYGIASSKHSASSWLNRDPELWSFQPRPKTVDQTKVQRPLSCVELGTDRQSLDDVMREFRMNGYDTPYNPDEDNIWCNQPPEKESLASHQYLRQSSWPAPEHSPAPRLRPAPHAPVDYNPQEFTATPSVFDIPSMPHANSARSRNSLTEEQCRVISALPDTMLYALLEELGKRRVEKIPREVQLECRFCKNNGERALYYRSHSLRDACGRLLCPVLRAHTCPRCGAAGDHAHTAKYCPHASHSDRIKSVAMMRSVRLASGKRRTFPETLAPSMSSVSVGTNYFRCEPAQPLDPLWAALEQKLML